MMKKPLSYLLAGLLCSLPLVSGHAYDAELAASLDKFYTKLNHKALADPKLLLERDKFYKDVIAKNVDYVLLDVRTDEETGMVKFSMPNSMQIPLDKLFTKQNLDSLPADKKIVVACRSGSRSLLAAANLKMLGFKDVHSLKEGIIGFASETSPETTLKAASK